MAVGLTFCGGALLAHAGCMTASGKVAYTEPVTRAGAWEKTVREHTRRGQVYFWQRRVVDMRATLVTPRLRSAFVAARDQLHGAAVKDFGRDVLALGQPPDEGMDRPMKSRPDAEEQILVYVAMYVAEDGGGDLDSRGSIWSTRLRRGDAVVEPVAIERKNFDPSFVSLLPHADRFDELYLFRFPMTDRRSGQALLAPGDTPLKFEVVSKLGDASVSWTLVGGAVGAETSPQPASPLPRKAKPAPGALPPSTDDDAPLPSAAPDGAPANDAPASGAPTPSGDAPADDNTPADSGAPADDATDDDDAPA